MQCKMSQANSIGLQITRQELRRREEMDPVPRKECERYCQSCGRQITETASHGEVGHARACDGDDGLDGAQTTLL